MARRSLNGLVVDTDINTRVRLKASLKQVVDDISLHQVRSNIELTQNLTKEAEFDIIFIRSVSSRDAIHAYLDLIKAAEMKKVPLTILIIRPEHSLTDYVGEYFVRGLDGFIREPYSIDALSEVISLASDNRGVQVKDEERIKRASKLLLRDALSSLDSAALIRFKNKGRGGGTAIKRMHEIKNAVRPLLEKISPEAHVSVLSDMIEEAAKNLNLNDFIKIKKVKKKAPHPGTILNRKLTDRKLDPAVIAAKLQITENDLAQIIKGEADLNQEVAANLAHVIGETEKFWLKLQAAYDEYVKEDD